MQRNYEIADFDTHTPFRCIVHHIGHVPPHVHEWFEILFVLSGDCSVQADEQLFSLREGDLMVVEGHIPHELRSSDCVYASVQLDLTVLENNFPNPMHPSFSCNSTLPGNEEAFDRLRRLIARLIRNNAEEQDGYELRNWILIYQLMDVLYTYFRVERSKAIDQRNHRYAQRIASLSSIINHHYTEDLPLSRVADMVHLSVPYLSKFFLEQFGMNYLTYVTQLRINHAVHELVNTDKNIEAISADSGFPNSHAFTKAFRQEYGVMPSVYRRRQRSEKKETPSVGVSHSDYLANLKQYLDDGPDRGSFSGGRIPAGLPPVTEHAVISFPAQQTELKHSWRDTVAIGKAADILLSDIQAVLRRIKEELGFRHLFFNGILSDELHVCSRGSSGELVYNFAYTDRIFDFLRGICLLPSLSFSYMPSALASQPDRRLFSHTVSEPARPEEWNALIEAFMQHVIRRYGIRYVSQWRFSVWHQPNTSPRLYGFRHDEDFFELWRSTRRILKSYAPQALFGFPPVFQNADFIGDNWFFRMYGWCREHECLPDFLNFTYYDTRLTPEARNTRETFGFAFTMVLNSSADGLKSFISHIRTAIPEKTGSGHPVYLSEWNNTPSQQDLLNDTCYKSCYIIKSIIENYDRLDSFSYWSVSDLMSESALPDTMLFGGLGLFTMNGLPKASYYALYLLSRLGDRKIAGGNGWMASLSGEEIRIICCHYIHLPKLYASGERFITSEKDRYAMFQSAAPRLLSIDLDGLPLPASPAPSITVQGLTGKKMTVQEYLVGRKGGSLYDAWERSGWICPDQPSERKLLEAHSMPSVRQYDLQAAEDGHFRLEIMLDPLDVKLVIIKLHNYEL